MVAVAVQFGNLKHGLLTHRRIIYALLMRELRTCYGGKNLGERAKID